MNERNIAHVPHDCVVKIRSVYDSVKSAERKAIDYILSKPRAVSGLTIVEFGRAAGCSVATVVRVSKRLGYDGYPSLRRAFRADPAAGGLADYGGVGKSDSGATVARKVFEASMNALRDTLALMDGERYERAVAALLGARKILICGVGDANLVALEAYQRFLRIGENCQVSEDPDVQLIMAAHLAPRDVLVAISHSGRSRTVLDVAKKARDMGATVIGITNFPVCPLAKNADVVLLTAAFSTHHTGEVISKRIAELAIVESLYISYLMRRGAPALRRLDRSNEAVRVHKL